MNDMVNILGSGFCCLFSIVVNFLESLFLKFLFNQLSIILAVGIVL